MERSVERRVLTKNGLLEPLQHRPRLDTERFDELLSCAAVGLERLRLPAVAIQREQQLGAQPLAKRVCGDELFQRRNSLGLEAELELRLDSELVGMQAQLFEAGDRGLRERRVREVG